MKYQKIIYLLLILLSLSGCINFTPDKTPSPVATTPEPESKIGIIEGTVTDAKTRKPLEGASLQVEKTKIKVLTDREGKYSIKNFPGTHIISIKKDGYKENKITRELAAGEKLTENILLVPLITEPIEEKTPTKKPVASKKDPLMLVTNYYSNELMVINLKQNTLLKKITTGQDPEGVTFSHEFSNAYIANSGENTVTVLNINTLTPAGHISVGDTPRNLISVKNYLYVVNSKDNDISVIDIKQNKKIKTIPVGKLPAGIIAGPAEQFIYVLNSRSNTVSVINCNSNSLVKTIETGEFPSSGALSPDGSILYVVNEVSEDLYIIDIEKEKLLGTLSLGKIPKNCLLLPSGDKLYIANYQDNTVSVIDCRTKTIIKTIDVGTNPTGMAYLSDKNRLYVANGGTNNISIIDVTSDQVTGKIPYGNFPYHMVIIE